MVEVVYRREDTDKNYQDAGFKLPKNIKQIGGGECDVQVYMEDNVALYLSKVPDRDEDIRYGVLLGSVKRSCGYTYIFINGAVDVRDIFDNTVLFTDDIWTALNNDISRFFSGSKVVGWFLSQNCSNPSQNVWIKKMHLNNFAGMDKVFMKIDREEDEEAFYYYGKEQLEKLPCYHIYYEKNRQMAQYMMDTNADIHFRNASQGEDRSGFINRAAQRKAEEIRSNVEKANSSAERRNGGRDEAKGGGRTKNAHDDNSRTEGGRLFAGSRLLKGGRAEKDDDKEKDGNTEKENRLPGYAGTLSRAASFLVIGALAVTVGVMGVSGRFDNLAGEFKSLISGIMNSGDSSSGGNGVISVNGVPSGNNDNQEEQTTGNTEENTTGPAEQDTTETPTDSQQQTEEPTSADDGTQPTEGGSAEGTQGEEQTASVIPAGTRSYMVQKGDTLYSICRKLYGNTDNVQVIIELNNLEDADNIYYGKNLIVP